MKVTAPGEAVDQLERDLGLTSQELAQALGVSPATLGRWRAGETYPRHKARQSLSQLVSLHALLRKTFVGREDIALWLNAQNRYLGGLRPIEAIRVRRFDRVEAAIEALNAGIFV